MIEYGIAVAEKRAAGERHRSRLSFLKDSVAQAKSRGFQDPPMGTAALEEFKPGQGPIERGILASINHNLGESSMEQLSSAAVLGAIFKAFKDGGLVDQDPLADTAGRWGELEERLPGLKDAMTQARRNFEAGRGVPLDLDAAREAHEPRSPSQE